MKQSIKRIYHPYWLWEEAQHNMWGHVDDKEKHINDCVELMNDTEKFASYMMDVVNQWEYSCEHNLSNTEYNRRAWLGWAACALAFNCPENITRIAWGKISEEKQNAANNEAEKAIKYWETNNFKNIAYA